MSGNHDQQNPQPKTQAYRAKTYRERRKQRIGMEAYREWEREKKRRQRSKMKSDCDKYEAQKKKDRERKVRKSHGNAETPEYIPSTSGFRNKQSLSKSVNRVKGVLPASTPKKLAVLSNVVRNLTPKSRRKLIVGVKSPNVGRSSFTESQKTWMTGFLKRGNISYTCPGRRDSTYMGKDDDGNKVYHANHYLLWYIREIVPLINEEIVKSFPPEEQFSVSYGSLIRFIKPLKYIRFRDNIPENSCTCEYCENLELLLVAIHNAYPDVPSNAGAFMCQVLCDKLRRECADGECATCGDDNEFFAGIMDSVRDTEEFTFFKWETAGAKFPQKKQQMMDGTDTAKELDKQVKFMKRHNFNNQRQHTELNDLKKTLPGSNSVIVQVDFSENYDNKQKNEIQSAYFGHQSFSLYTAVMWYGSGSEVVAKSFCFVSDSTSHSKLMVLHYNKVLIEHAREMVPQLDKVHFWSDGCASQFRSKFCFHLLATSYPTDIKLTWSYFESHHGKGPVDGIGGKVKCTVYSDVKAGLVVVSSGEEFAQHADTRVKTKTVFVAEDEINSRAPEFPERVPDVPGTLRVRFIDRTYDPTSGTATLHFFRNSQFSDKWLGQDQQFCEQAYKVTSSDDGTSCEEDEDVTSREDRPSEQDGVGGDSTFWEPGDWVIVKYDDKLYPGEVIDVRGTNTFVHAMCKSGGNWKWPEQDGTSQNDTLWYTREKVKAKIPPPVPVGSRGQYRFIDLPKM